MGAGHSHDHAALSGVAVARGPRLVLNVVLVLAAVACIAGLFSLWPDQARVDKIGEGNQFAAPGVTFPEAEVLKLYPACKAGEQPEESAGGTCGRIDVRVTTGETKGARTSIQVIGPITQSGLRPGDILTVMRIPGQGGGQESYSYTGVKRDRPLAILAIAFVVVVLVVARLRGLLALLSLGVAGLVVAKFVLPAILIGTNAIAVALVGSAAIMFVVLYMTHGLSTRTSAALAGTLVGVGITAAIGDFAVGASRLSGVADETAQMLTSIVGGLDFQGLLICAIIIAGLGVLNDVTITQSSAVWELRAAAPTMGRARLFTSAMRIGRDHIASTIYTIVFAYAGAALSVLLVLYLYNRPFLELLGTEEIGAEVVRTLASAIGLVLAVPITTAIAALTVGPPAPVGAEGSEVSAAPDHPDSPYVGKRRRR